MEHSWKWTKLFIKIERENGHKPDLSQQNYSQNYINILMNILP